ncbi:MAG: threonine--tRNA ligase, partial [Desulfovibrio sp.]|nr:threonine--tRNA ligase [Desulfovibrio sp.]
IEQYAGALPTWLAPEQARILTVTEAWNEAADKVCEALVQAGVRAKVDGRNEKLGFKVREAQMAKIPFMFVVGEKEAQSGTVSVRLRSGEDLGTKSVEEAVELVKAQAEEPFKQGGMSYSFA